MALLHRRILYPRPNATDCLTVCDAACQYYQLCSYSPPPYSSLPSNSTPNEPHHDSNPFPIPLVAAACFIAAASLLLLLALYALHRFRRRHRRGPSSAAAQDDGGGDLFEVGEADGHHAWHIRTVGLDEPTIRSIAIWAYKPGEGLLGAAGDGCPVCLADFRDGELLRLLPKCGHAFHLPCIDTWLRSHLNCPLCRAPIVAPATAALPPPPPPPPFVAATADLVDPNSGTSPLAEDTQIAVRPPETDRVEVEGETESGVAEPGAGIGIAMDPLAASSSSPPSSQFWVRSGPGEDGSRPVRRSVSMDSSSLAAHLFRADPEAGSSEERKDSDLEEEGTTKKGEKQGSASKGVPQQKDPRELERSASSSSRRLFLSGHGRGRSAVLPL